jgi:outer membrane receptor protein involved in Fe transport
MASTNPQITQAMRRALYATVTVPVVALIAPNVMAQDVQDELEEVVVVGSRIARDPNAGANVPVQSVSADDIQLSGKLDLGEVLSELPSLLTSNTSSNSATGIFGTGSGETAGSADVGETVLQLRGLGVERTLVLVNGRRHVSGVAGTQAVDIGSIPQQLIERVEVLTGGASAIYGADAVTGVVNFVMKDDYDGLNFNVVGGMSGEGDGDSFTASGLYGLNFADDRGNIAIAASYTQRDSITHGSRGFSRNNGIGSDDQNPARRFQTGDIDAVGTPNFARFYAPSTSFPSTDAPCDLYGYNYCYGFHPTGFSILDEASFLNLYAQAFPGDPIPTLTAAEQALISRATNSPTRLISGGHNFSLTSNGGVLLPGSIFDPGLDIDANGVNDCEQSWQGFYSTFTHSPPAPGFIGGCWIIEDNGTVRPLRDGLIAGDINQFGEDGVADGSDEDMLLPDDNKWSINLTGNYDFNGSVSGFFESKYVRQETTYTVPLNTFWDLLTISADNPYITQLPPDLAAVGQAEGLFITRDPNDLGPNNDESTRETMRFVVGLEGELNNGWGWEVSANYGKFEQEFEDRNRLIVDRWFAAIDAVDDGNGNVICRSDIDPTPPATTPFNIPVFAPSFHTFNPGDGQCRPANILGGVGAISQEAIDFVTTTIVNEFETEQFVLSAIMTGEAFDLPAGPVSFAGGLEYRDESSKSTFDPLVRGVQPVTTAFGNAGQLMSEIYAGQFRTQRSLVFDPGSETQNVDGGYDVAEIFGEVSVPLLADKAFARDLTLDAAVRFSEYSTIGSTTTWNVGGSWSPVSDTFRVRGSYSFAVRAPNIDELFSPAQGASFRPVDPCDSAEIAALNAANDPRGPIRAANCLAAGIPANFTDPLTARFVGETSGNPLLSQEEADTFSIGFVLQPEEFLAGLSVTVDYWDITIEDAIDAPSSQSIVNGCYDSAVFPGNQFCDLVRRNDDPGSPQFNGLSFISQQQVNIGKLEASGIDFAVRYLFDLQSAEVSLGLSGTKMDKLDRFFDVDDPTAVDPELGELQRPELAGSFEAGVRIGNFAARYQMQYMDEQGLRDVEIETAPTLYGPAGIADETYIHDLSASFDISDRYRVFGGVNNFTDETPFLTENAFPVNPLGRFFFIGLDANF